MTVRQAVRMLNDKERECSELRAELDRLRIRNTIMLSAINMSNAATTECKNKLTLT